MWWRSEECPALWTSPQMERCWRSAVGGTWAGAPRAATSMMEHWRYIIWLMSVLTGKKKWRLEFIRPKLFTLRMLKGGRARCGSPRTGGAWPWPPTTGRFTSTSSGGPSAAAATLTPLGTRCRRRRGGRRRRSGRRRSGAWQPSSSGQGSRSTTQLLHTWTGQLVVTSCRAPALVTNCSLPMSMSTTWARNRYLPLRPGTPLGLVGPFRLAGQYRVSGPSMRMVVTLTQFIAHH
mmetsp:Transcript_33122/g.52064  ORF Transcript_33122/g.52064 Transcript_33122/m.52064 type:complete len:234 (+) Transcript_33122:293-994(+)